MASVDGEWPRFSTAFDLKVPFEFLRLLFASLNTYVERALFLSPKESVVAAILAGIVLPLGFACLHSFKKVIGAGPEPPLQPPRQLLTAVIIRLLVVLGLPLYVFFSQSSLRPSDWKIIAEIVRGFIDLGVGVMLSAFVCQCRCNRNNLHLLLWLSFSATLAFASCSMTWLKMRLKMDARIAAEYFDFLDDQTMDMTFAYIRLFPVACHVGSTVMLVSIGEWLPHLIQEAQVLARPGGILLLLSSCAALINNVKTMYPMSGTTADVANITMTDAR
jgi:hypothetical protein